MAWIFGPLMPRDLVCYVYFVMVIMFIISWNVCGLGRREKKRSIRSLIRSNMSVMLFIQESKCSNVTPLGCGILDKVAFSDTEGDSRHIIFLWVSSTFSCSEMICKF